MQIAFIDSWIQTIAEGSGTAAGIGGLQRALLARGHRVSRLAPPMCRPANLTARRLLFNAALPALLRTFRYDLVLGFDIDGWQWSRARGGSPYLASIKGVIAEEMQHEGGQVRALFEVLSRLEAANARHADAVLTTSDYCRRAIGRHYGIAHEKVRLVPEGIDLPRWQRLAAAEAHTSDGATILCVARQYPRKHVADLLRALPAVRRAVPRAHAIIAGDGPEHGALRALATQLGLGEAVRFTGALPDDELARLYRHADVFCLPSVQEGFGIVFLEAMANALPVVATTGAAIPEVVPQRRAGTLVAPGDHAALADALIELLSDAALRRAYGEAGQAHVAQFGWDRVAGVFLEQVAPFVAR
jgi:glycosyltransferase involved in cell wall biosynthesis